MAKCIFYFSPASGTPEIWLESEDQAKLLIEARKTIEDNGEGRARFIIDGKMCLVSQAVQQFYVQNPVEGQPPLPLGPLEAPTFDKDGNVSFLVKPPEIHGD